MRNEVYEKHIINILQWTKMNSEQHALPATTQAQQEVRYPPVANRLQNQTTNAQMTTAQMMRCATVSRIYWDICIIGFFNILDYYFTFSLSVMTLLCCTLDLDSWFYHVYVYIFNTWNLSRNSFVCSITSSQTAVFNEHTCFLYQVLYTLIYDYYVI